MALHHPPAEALITKSFRDPAGIVEVGRDRVVRRVRAEALPEVDAFVASPLNASLVDSRRLIGTQRLAEEPPGDGFAAAFEHPRIELVTYPYEWCPGMLYAAGSLTIDIALEASESGWGLKDASPFNIAFNGPSPVFLDILSFERRDPGDATWLAYSQFVRTFILPLLAVRETGLSLKPLFSEADGVEPRRLRSMMPRLSLFGRAGFTHVTLPSLLEGGAEKQESLHKRRVTGDAEKARFVLTRVLKSLRKSLESVKPSGKTSSHWSSYTSDGPHADEYHRSKARIVDAALRDARPRRVLDLGCNTGALSLSAARAGASVVALDSDATVVEKAYETARNDSLDVLPMVMDIADPSAARGWMNSEYPSFLSRAEGAFDVVLALSLLHHLVVTARVPLAEVMSLLACLTRNLVIVEFVPAADPMFRKLLRGRDSLHEHHTREAFIDACSTHFTMESSASVDGSSREIFILRKKAT